MAVLAGQRLVRGCLQACDNLDQEATKWRNPTDPNVIITEDDTCLLCHDHFSEDNKPYALHCGHVYHRQCIQDDLTNKVNDYYQNHHRLPNDLECPNCQLNNVDIGPIDNNGDLFDQLVNTIEGLANDAIKICHNTFAKLKPFGLKAIEWIKECASNETLKMGLLIASIVSLGIPAISVTCFAASASLSLIHDITIINELTSFEDRKNQYLSPKMLLSASLCGLAGQRIFSSLGFGLTPLPMVGIMAGIYGSIYLYENYLR